jgi:hypothetical protein
MYLHWKTSRIKMAKKFLVSLFTTRAFKGIGSPDRIPIF